MLRQGVLRVFVSFCVLDFVRAILLRIFSFSTLLYFYFVFIYFPVVLFNSLVALLKRMNGQFFSFSSPENVEKVRGLLQRKTGLNPQ